MTNKKISFAFELKQKIQDCSSLADLQAIIEEGINKTTFSDKGLVDEGWFFKSELKKTLNTLYDLIVRSTMDSTDDKKMSNH